MRSHWWWDLSARDFAELDMSGVVAVQPVGAVEQHGPHLPVSVDATINAGIVARAVEKLADLPVLVLPMLPVGKSDEHLAYPGTLTLTNETLTAMWLEIGESVHRAGCRRIIYFNSHGGQLQQLWIVARELRRRFSMLAVGCLWARATDLSDLFDAEERLHGIHAGEVETSMMLHLAGHLVDMSAADDFVPLSVEMVRSGSLLRPEGVVNFGWQAQDLHPSGAAGNAAAADAARGKQAVERAADALVTLCREVAEFPLERLSNPTIYSRD